MGRILELGFWKELGKIEQEFWMDVGRNLKDFDRGVWFWTDLGRLFG